MSDAKSPMPAGQTPGGVQTATPIVKSKDLIDIAVERGYCSHDQILKTVGELGIDPTQTSAADLLALLQKTGVINEHHARACERALKGPTKIGGFELLEKVGQGGMGAVFRARQLSMDRIVALKILPPKLAQDAGFKQRFLHEARISARLSHLNIINGIDCGEAGGFTFFAMEFVDGKTIKQILKERGKLPPAEAYAIVRQIADALVYASRESLVHRDIKPENIMLTKQGVAKLCDLGLAKKTESAEEASMTQAGQAVGTPHYISPEQARGEKGIDGRSDIYSLGATFYHMLAGKTCFDAPTGASVMALHITTDAPSPCELDSNIPIGYGQVISKMMAKSPDNRYASAQELVDDLNSIKAGKRPVAAQFNSRTSCAMPSAKARASRTTTGPHESINRTASSGIPGGSKAIAVAGLLAVLALGAVVVVAMRKPDAQAKVEPKPIDVKPPDVKAVPDVPKPVIPDVPKVAQNPVPNPAPVIPEPKKPEPKVKKPVVPVVPAEPTATATLVPPPPEEPPAPKLEMTADVIYSRFLHEIADRSPKDLSKTVAEMRDLSLDSAYRVASADIRSELNDLDGAVKFEQNALQAIAARGGDVPIAAENIKRMLGADKAHVSRYDPQHGLFIKSGPVEVAIPPSGLPIDAIIEASPDKAPLSRALYYAARGKTVAALGVVPSIQDDTAVRRLQRKFHLAIATEAELLAGLLYDNLAKVAQAQQWHNFKKLLGEFNKAYATSSPAVEHADQLKEWTAAAAEALAPKEGLEAVWRFQPEKWDEGRPCESSVVTDAETGNKILVIEAEAMTPDANFEKCAIAHYSKQGIDFSAKTKLVLLARNSGKEKVQLELGLVRVKEKYRNAGLIALEPGQWYEVAFKIDEPPDANTEDKAAAEKIHRIVFVVYSHEACKVELHNIVLK